MYINEKNIVHADIAARNILVTISNEPNVRYAAKIGDLGLSKSLQSQQIYYQSTSGAFAVKWSAPVCIHFVNLLIFQEVAEYGKFSLQTDIWSFGVTLFEIFSLGQIPYAYVPNEEIGLKIKQGHRLAQPELCPDDVYKMMLEMWNLNPKGIKLKRKILSG